MNQNCPLQGVKKTEGDEGKKGDTGYWKKRKKGRRLEQNSRFDNRNKLWPVW